MADAPAQDELRFLLSRFVDGEMNLAEQDAVAARLRGDREARRLYVRLVSLDHLLRKELVRSTAASAANPDWADILRESAMSPAPAVVVPDFPSDGPSGAPAAPPAKQSSRQKTGASRRSGAGSRIAAAIFVLATAALWLLMRRGSRDATSLAKPLATVTATAGAVWSGPAFSSGTAGLAAGFEVNLQSGCVELKLIPSGARVVLEGPARCTFTSSTALLLDSGKLAAHVSGGGLVVTTPTATITDLGTEFGVDYRPGGATDVEVFRGRVRASPGGAASAGQARIITEGEAASVSAAAVKVDVSGAVPQHFVRDLQPQAVTLDVVDLMAGGDGTTHRRGFAIDPTTGQAGLLPARGVLRGDGQYHRVPSLPLIDGCFVPHGRLTVQIDSAGHTYKFAARDNATFSQIWAGGAIPWSHPDVGGIVPSSLAGIDYAQPGHGPLYMPANKGLTLDLEAIRHLYPGMAPARFRSVVGNSFDSRTPLPNRHPRADVFVLVDGQVRFQKTKFSNEDGGFMVDVPLGAGDRFLTLVTTDGGDLDLFGWVLFGDPAIQLDPR